MIGIFKKTNSDSEQKMTNSIKIPWGGWFIIKDDTKMQMGVNCHFEENGVCGAKEHDNNVFASEK